MASRRSFITSLASFPLLQLTDALNILRDRDDSKGNLSKNILITGTRSGVGKHTVACALTRTLKEHGELVVPFKPVAVDIFPEANSPFITTSTIIQSIAAGIEPFTQQNPIRFIPNFASGNKLELFIDGKLIENYDISSSSYIIEKGVEDAITFIEKNYPDATIVIEDAGSLEESSNSEWFKKTVERLEPTIVLVSDTFYGGAFSSVIGILDLIPKSISDRLKAVLFNRINVSPHEEPVVKWRDYLKTHFNIKSVYTLPNFIEIAALSEDIWPLKSPSIIEQDIEYISAIFRTTISVDALSTNITKPI